MSFLYLVFPAEPTALRTPREHFSATDYGMCILGSSGTKVDRKYCRINRTIAMSGVVDLLSVGQRNIVTHVAVLEEKSRKTMELTKRR